LAIKSTDERGDCGLHGSVNFGPARLGVEAQQMSQLDVAAH